MPYKDKQKRYELSRNWWKRNPGVWRRYQVTNTKDKNKISARKKVHYAVSVGKILKQINCDRCLDTYRVQAHHEDYAKPLDIIWLCDSCHQSAHHST